jgi:Family of unknown function (DUF6356)
MTIARRTIGKQCLAWVMRAEHRERIALLTSNLNKAFTRHPEATDETYWQHLWFTSKMSARFLVTTLVIMIHGIFPFLLTRTASAQTEAIYRIMKARIPKSRQDIIDLDYHV